MKPARPLHLVPLGPRSREPEACDQANNTDSVGDDRHADVADRQRLDEAQGGEDSLTAAMAPQPTRPEHAPPEHAEIG